MQESLGNIRVVRMIWVQTIGVFGALLFCYLNSAPHAHLPTIVDLAKIYPNSIVFRIGMLYSMFIMFLINLFITWWLNEVNDTLQRKRHLISHAWIALFSVVMYSLFVSCIDNARINYDWVHTFVSWAGLGFGFLIDSITWNIKTLKKAHPTFIKGSSWKMKKIHTIINVVLQVMQFAIAFGQLDISWKVPLEWLMIANVMLYFFTFRIDFKKAMMGVQVDEWNQPAQQQAVPMAEPIYQYQQHPFQQ